MNKTRRSHRGGNLFGSKKIATMYDPQEKNVRSMLNKALGLPNFRKMTQKQKNKILQGAKEVANQLGITVNKQGGRRTKKDRKGRKTRKYRH
jgi:hypothetical protein